MRIIRVTFIVKLIGGKAMPVKKIQTILLTLAFIMPLHVAVVNGFEVGEITVLTADDAGAGDQYGFCMDTDGRWLVVGAKYTNYGGSTTGGVYVYRRDLDGQWRFTQKLVPNKGVDHGEFGESVAIFHNRIAVGARSMIAGNGHQSGTAYLYKYRGRRAGWVLETEIEPMDGKDGDEFGRSVALSPNRIMVGARFASNDQDERSGAVYVYKRGKNGWGLDKKILDPEGKENDQFGRSISCDHFGDGRLAVGSRKGIDGISDSPGKILIFNAHSGEWSLSHVIMAEDGVAGDYFGQSVVMAGDLMVIGARDAHGEKGEKVGAAYIYRFNFMQESWILEQKLSAPDGKKKAQFGFAVDFDRFTATNLAVSARRADSASGKKTGQVYLYSYNALEKLWSLDDIVVPKPAATDDEFGQSLAMDPFGGSWLVVGADQASLPGLEEAGAAYILNETITDITAGFSHVIDIPDM